MSTTGALVNDGNLYLDRLGGDGGSSLTVAGALTNSGVLKVGNYHPTRLSASDKVTATSIHNSGQLALYGNYTYRYQALLDVTAGSAGFGVAGTLTGSVELISDTAIEFLSGQISTIAASSELTLPETPPSSRTARLWARTAR